MEHQRHVSATQQFILCAVTIPAEEHGEEPQLRELFQGQSPRLETK